MKLLNRTATAYFVVSLVLLLVSTPIFYYVLHRLFVEEADETLLSRKHFVVSRLGQIKSEREITDWTRFEDDISVSPLSADAPLLRDTIYDGVVGQDEYFRELVAQVSIIGRPYRLAIRSSMLENGDLIGTIVLSQVLLLGALLLCLLLINQWIAGQIWQPFYEILARLKEYSPGQRTLPQLPATTIIEFNELNEVVDKMRHKIQKDFTSLKQFSENASHEIQTPLAIIRSTIETMVQDAGVSAEQMRSLQSMYVASGRLSRLNQALLLLTKIDNDQFSQTKRLNFKTLMEDTLTVFEDFIQARNLLVESELSDCWLEVNAALAHALLTNLLGNSIRHNLDGGVLKLTLTQASLKVSNPGLAPAVDPAVFFERFHKADPQSDSLGLGLALVKEICDYSQWKVMYLFDQGWHTIRVDFNRNQE